MIYVGLANGSIMESFLLAYFPLILYGCFLIYEDIAEAGCDPSGSVSNSTEFDTTPAGVIGALMGTYHENNPAFPVSLIVSIYLFICPQQVSLLVVQLSYNKYQRRLKSSPAQDLQPTRPWWQSAEGPQMTTKMTNMR
jgi:hypothetical protein